MKRFWLCYYIHIILLEFGPSEELLRPSREFKIFCNSKWGEMTPGQHRLMVQDCIVYFCQELNATEVKLHEIFCQDYLNYVLPDNFPENARKIYRVLCKTCNQPSISKN